MSKPERRDPEKGKRRMNNVLEPKRQWVFDGDVNTAGLNCATKNIQTRQSKRIILAKTSR